MLKPQIRKLRGKFRMTSQFLHKQLADTSIERGNPVRTAFMDRISMIELLASDGVPPMIGQVIQQVDFRGVIIVALDRMPTKTQNIKSMKGYQDGHPFWIFFTAADIPFTEEAKDKPF